MSNKKIKILTLSDHPLSPSGVGTQTQNMILGLLRSGKFQVISLGGAIKHAQYQPQRLEEFGEDWTIYPVDGYGTQDMVRSILRTEKPDIVWFMTDPRFWGWLWEMEQEIRAVAPMVYYHVWDNKPYPTFNKQYYESNDAIATISKVTDDIVRTVAPSVECVRIPHAVDNNVFKKQSEEIVNDFIRGNFPNIDPENKPFICFWNNRNARRKQSGTLIFWFKEFLDMVGHENAKLIMHTDVKDPNGQDLYACCEHLGLLSGQVTFSEAKLPPHGLAALYNMADCTINIADAEGFGLGTLESLSCETPILVNMTGGLQEQVTDGENWFGVGIEPASKAVIGSQPIPWIYEDRASKDDFIEGLMKLYTMSKAERGELGRQGRAHVIKNYNFENYLRTWQLFLEDLHERHGSWENRKNYQSWTLKEV